MTTRDFDVLVIGGGMAGATAAAHCAATRRVAVLEAEETAGYHSTGRSAAIWIQNYGPPDVRRLTAASRGFFESPPEGFTASPLLTQRPVVTLAPEDQTQILHDMLAAGEGLEPIGLAEVAALLPPLRPGYAAAAAIERDAFDIDVNALHAGFLKTARSGGGTLELRARAGRIWHAGGQWHAEARDGTVFRAEILVNASGAWGDEVAVLAGLPPLGLQPKRRTAIIVDPGCEDCGGWPLVGDAAHSWYVRPEARRKLMVSPADETDVPPHDVQPEEIDIALAIDRMRQALDIPVTRVEHRWAGLRSFAPDRSLVIGFDAVAPGFVWMIGQGGYGIQTAPAAGRLVAALVAGAVPDDLAGIVTAVDPARFGRRP